MTNPLTSRTSVTHTCPGGCGLQIAAHHFACHTDWLRLPFALRKDIQANYRRNPAAHFQAMSAAMAWYAANPHPCTPDVPTWRQDDVVSHRDHTDWCGQVTYAPKGKSYVYVAWGHGLAPSMHRADELTAIESGSS